MLTDDTVMEYFYPGRKTRMKTDTGPGAMAATVKQYDPEAKRCDQSLFVQEHSLTPRADDRN